MKKLLLIICFLLCFNSAYAISTVDELIEICHKDPFEISMWIAFQIKYVDDWPKWRVEDYWQSPTETLSTMTGDCEDYAILAYAVLKQLGYHPRIFVIYNNKDAHAICIVRYKGAWYYLGEELLTRTKAHSYIGIVKCYNADNDTKYTYYYFLKETEFRLN